ncbi:hypothetical protein F5J12DRAFT_785395 [Pisolithus orientalis]|uniref:uncharacterized protein n=1 Tax=Pisolithus orientalis TaxID=936130 RepID=UPI002224E127|nr:uncharacterized protein F5J12DRAFT_785395 [Pisolithus orientalis]KAI5996614.1 hypothetical protein F5J12DRAFT_785395 [Pisolithus orientalis]
MPLVPFNLTNTSYSTAPPVPFNPANTSYSTAPPIPTDLGHLMGSMAYLYSPPNFDYAPSALVTRQLHHLSSHIFPYSTQTQCIGHIERPLRGGEEASNQHFVISRQSVIQQVVQTMQIHPTPDASSSATINPGLQAADISIAALQETMLGRTGGNWLKNQHNDLTVPVQRHSEEVQLCKDWILYLLKDFMWLDETKMVQILSLFDYAANNSIAVVPFGHPALVQLVLNLLWGEKQYCRFVNIEQRDLKVVIALATGTQRIFQWNVFGT